MAKYKLTKQGKIGIALSVIAVTALILTIGISSANKGGNGGEIITPSIDENVSEDLSSDIIDSGENDSEETSNDTSNESNIEDPGVSTEPLEKKTAEITFNNVAGGSFYSTDLDWLHNVPTDAEYVVTYDCGELGISGATVPEDNGYGWSQIVTVVENDIYEAASSYSPWFYFEGDSNIEIRGFTDEEYGASVADSSNRDYAMDGSTDTFLWVKAPKTSDSYIEFTLDELTTKSYIFIEFGNDDGEDSFNCNVSVSADKKTYVELHEYNNYGDENSKCYEMYHSEKIDYKYIRLTNNETTTWVAIREITLQNFGPLT